MPPIVNTPPPELQDILQVKLGKPKKWRWQLTTSKSTPNLIIPIIQLCDRRGNLLAEIREQNGGCKRSWRENTSKNREDKTIKTTPENDPRTEKMTKKNVSSFEKNGKFDEKLAENVNFKKSEITEQESEKLPRTKSFTIDTTGKWQGYLYGPNALETFTNDQITPKKYKLRSSRAGTLVVSDDSLSIKSKRHRKINSITSIAEELTPKTDENVVKLTNMVKTDKKQEETRPRKTSRPRSTPIKTSREDFCQEWVRSNFPGSIVDGPVFIENKPVSIELSDSGVVDMSEVMVGDLERVCSPGEEVSQYLVEVPETPRIGNGNDDGDGEMELVNPFIFTYENLDVDESVGLMDALDSDSQRRAHNDAMSTPVLNSPIYGKLSQRPAKTLNNRRTQSSENIWRNYKRRVAKCLPCGRDNAACNSSPLPNRYSIDGSISPLSPAACIADVIPATADRYRITGSLPNGLDDHVIKLDKTCDIIESTRVATCRNGNPNLSSFSCTNNQMPTNQSSQSSDTGQVMTKKKRAPPAPPIRTTTSITSKTNATELNEAHHTRDSSIICDQDHEQGHGVECTTAKYEFIGAFKPKLDAMDSSTDPLRNSVDTSIKDSMEAGVDHGVSRVRTIDGEGFLEELQRNYSFIQQENIFTVTLSKNSCGCWGFCVSGGMQSASPFAEFIRIKRLAPYLPAGYSGQLQHGDLLLSANEISLVGLTSDEARDIFRSISVSVILTVCRPPPEIRAIISPVTDVPAPPPPPKRESTHQSSTNPSDEHFVGVFEITLIKVKESLGFTIRKDDESGHYVRALVREPAISDGRIKPGDKIVTVNGMEITWMSHREAVQFIRQCGDEVLLKLFRDVSYTPPLSRSSSKSSLNQESKKLLRTEASEFLQKLAVDRHGNAIDTADPRTVNDDVFSDYSTRSSPRKPARRAKLMSDSDDYDGKGSYHKPESSHVESVTSSNHAKRSSCGSYTSESESDANRPIRPNFLDLHAATATPAATPIVPNRKSKFQFSLAQNSYELNNLNADVLDAPNLAYKGDKVDECDGGGNYSDSDNMLPDEPVSMPMFSHDKFDHTNPAYQSAHGAIRSNGTHHDYKVWDKYPQDKSDMHRAGEHQTSHRSSQTNANDHVNHSGTLSRTHLHSSSQKHSMNQTNQKNDNTSSFHVSNSTGDNQDGLMKWKSVVFTPEDDIDDIIEAGSRDDVDILVIELNRGWNSRLGFSLQQGIDGGTFISAVHPGSVAYKDGRLKVGDQLLKVNDENVCEITTDEVIKLLRILSGPVCVVIARDKRQ